MPGHGIGLIAKRRDRRASGFHAALHLGDCAGDRCGALGRCGFDENGDTTMQTHTVSVVRDGKFEFEEVLDASAVGEGGEKR